MLFFVLLSDRVMVVAMVVMVDRVIVVALMFEYSFSLIEIFLWILLQPLKLCLWVLKTFLFYYVFLQRFR